MILRDIELLPWARRNVHPFDENCINPASIDLRLDSKWRDIDEPNIVRSSPYISIFPRTLRVEIHNYLAKWLRHRRKPTAILATTLETVIIGPDKAASIKLKTTPTREGLGHPIADWVDPGFVGQLTLMLYANKAVNLQVGSKIIQMVVFQLDGPVGRDYGVTGHYQGQRGPTPSWRLE